MVRCTYVVLSNGSRFQGPGRCPRELREHPNDPNSAKTAANPNSFIYRFIPYKVSDLSAGGKLQALQIRIAGDPITFVPVDVLTPFGDVFFTNQLKLHTLRERLVDTLGQRPRYR